MLLALPVAFSMNHFQEPGQPWFRQSFVHHREGHPSKEKPGSFRAGTILFSLPDEGERSICCITLKQYRKAVRFLTAYSGPE
jgi:hypothetical protein